MRKNLLAIFAILLPLSLMAQEEYKNHNINYGVIKGKTTLQDAADKNDKDKYDFWGFGVQYQYRPLNFLNVFAGIDFGSGKLNNKEANKTYHPKHGELEIDLGYRFVVHPMITLTPFIGRTGYALTIHEDSYEPIGQITTDLKLNYGATNLGMLVEATPNHQLTIGIKPMIQFTDNVKTEIKNKHKSTGITAEHTTKFKNRLFFKLDVPVTYNISESFGIIGTFSYNARKLEDKDTPSSKTNFDNYQAKIGLSHSF